ncbi:piggyBac transposable element-derived protein 4-like [Vespa velutina]|uniref:piggyBac transposable element-derived protein 4-like n=1 Tax=Vespa velutina TaxID=202808 RepID=UPI001FB52C95|nr:piggyBac transposable element-derived protein 4-like [Vespa velutina]XP_047361947.1 piggyBac transposable element-derived protein 4-like [Vespa velutina]
MAKRSNTNESHDTSSSEDELQIDVYTDMLERLIVEENDSSDSDIVQATRRRKDCIDSDSNESDTKENTPQHDNVSSSEEWEDVTESGVPPVTINFDLHDEIAGPQLPNNVKEPIEYFTLYFTEELADSIIKETNNYANEEIRKKQLSRKSTWHNWHDITKEEFLAFIAVILNMGLIQLPNIQEYWSTASNSRIPFFPETFTRARFMQIFWMLHLKKPTQRNATIRTRIQKVSNYLEYIDDKFRQYFIPYKAVVVDESIVKCKGRIAFITYNPNKPTKWGIRIYALTDSKTGYLFTILPYYGSITSDNISRSDLPVTTRIPLHLYNKLLNRIPDAKGYHMYTDRYYTSILLAEELLKMNCHLTGTIQVNRKGVPTQIKKPKFSRKTTVAYRKNSTTLLAWKDKRIITILTNYYNTQLQSTHRTLRGGHIVTVNKPEMVLEYMANMGGVDRADQYASTYCFLCKSLKWWRKLFFWGLEMCVINSYIIYRISKQTNNETPMTHHKFVKVLIDQLRGDFRESRTRPSTSSADNRLENKLHIPDVGQRKRDCIVCSDRKTPGGRRQTTYYCQTCTNQPAMHFGECFKVYHTVLNYKK